LESLVHARRQSNEYFCHVALMSSFDLTCASGDYTMHVNVWWGRAEEEEGGGEKVPEGITSSCSNYTIATIISSIEHAVRFDILCRAKWYPSRPIFVALQAENSLRGGMF